MHERADLDRKGVTDFLLIASELQVEAAKSELRIMAGVDGRQGRIGRAQETYFKNEAWGAAAAHKKRNNRERVIAATHASMQHDHLSDAARCAMGIR